MEKRCCFEMKNSEKAQVNTSEMITVSRVEYEEKNARLEAQEKRIASLEHQVDLLMEAIRLAKQKKYGSSSEHITDDGMEQLSLLFNEAEVYVQEEQEQSEAVPVAAHKRRKKHEYTMDEVPEGLPTEVIEHRLEGEDLVCPACGNEMREIGKEVVNKLKIKPAEVIVEQHVYYSYACGNCNKKDIETPVAKAPREPSVLPGSFATAEAISYIMTQKFVMGTPIYRLEQELKRQGVQLSRQTMSNWILMASERLLSPVYKLLHQEMLTRKVLHADETTLQVLHEPGKKATSESYIWLYRTSGDSQSPIALYEYQPGRGAKHPTEFLGGFQGYLHTDGYAGYHNLPEEITVVGCWAHARRKFDEAMKALPKGKAKGSSAAQGLAYCELLFKIEDSLAELPPEERYQQRLKQAKPVLDAMLAWANLRTAAPKSALGKALNYLKAQWPYLTNYLKDGRLELSNNRAERSIKPFVIDRKNFLFANTPRGATGSAVIFSLIQTALENRLDPYCYLTWLMKEACRTDLTDEDNVQALLPWNAPAECQVKTGRT